MTNNTRRHPRTLQEAFGPYTSRDLVDTTRTPDKAWAIVLALVAVGLLIWVGVSI